MRTWWLVVALVLSLLLALLESWALSTYLFWHYPWSDTVLHAVGGAAIGTFVVGLANRTFRPRTYIVVVTIAALAWEVFEYVIGVPKSANFWLDTASDLLFDFLGALVPYLVARFTLWRSV